MSDLLVLHALRIKGVSGPEAICTSTGLSIDEVVPRLSQLEAMGFIRKREGVVAGWSLTESGRRRDRELIDNELLLANQISELSNIYKDFRPLNSTFLKVCTDWQIKETDGVQVVNRHDDPSYDQLVLTSLFEIAQLLEPILLSLGTALARFCPYIVRLRTAIAHVADGDTQWFTGPLVDSVHTVWFELHEDLLTTLNVPRSSEVGS